MKNKVELSQPYLKQRTFLFLNLVSNPDSPKIIFKIADLILSKQKDLEVFQNVSVSPDPNCRCYGWDSQ